MVVVLALIGVLIALISVFVAIFFVMRKRQELKITPEICTKAVVLGTYNEIYSSNNNFSSATVDGYNAWEEKKYYVDFRLDNGKQIRFLIKEDRFLSCFDGDRGVIRYKGDRLISFEKETSIAVLKDVQPLEEACGIYDGKSVKFYGSMPALGMNIFSTDARDVSLKQICSIIDKIYDNKSENFIVLEDLQGVILQFSNDGKSKTVLMEIPCSQPQGVYVGQFGNLADVKRCVQDYFDGVSITFNYPVKFQHW